MRSIFAVILALSLAAPCMAATRDVQSGNIWRVDWDTTSTEVHLFISGTTSGAITEVTFTEILSAGTGVTIAGDVVYLTDGLFVPTDGGTFTDVVEGTEFQATTFTGTSFVGDLTGNVNATTVTATDFVGARRDTWEALTAATDFTTTVYSQTALRMVASQVANFGPGDAIRWTGDGVVKYGLVTSMDATTVSFIGPAVGTTLTAISYCTDPAYVKAIPLPTISAWALTASSTLEETYNGTKQRWNFGKAYVVGLSATQTGDGAATVNMWNDATTTTILGAALTVSSTWNFSTGVGTTTYVIDNGDDYDIAVVTTGTDASNTNLNVVVHAILSEEE